MNELLFLCFECDFEPTPLLKRGEVSVAKAVGAMHMDTRRGAASKLEQEHTPPWEKLL